MEPDQNITDDSKNVKKIKNWKLVALATSAFLCGVYLVGANPEVHRHKKLNEMNQLLEYSNKLGVIADNSIAKIRTLKFDTRADYIANEKLFDKYRSTIDSTIAIQRTIQDKMHANFDYLVKHENDNKAVLGSWYTYFKE